MKTNTKLKFKSYFNRQQELNGTSVSFGENFTVAPNPQQKLMIAVQESTAFLSRINVIGVDEMVGQKIKMGITGPIASRTNTDNADRQTKSPVDLTDQNYQLTQTNYDTHITYGMVDQWAKFPTFADKFNAMITRQMSLDIIMAGWNGTSIATDTDIIANPLLQDVNIGWIQQVRNNKPENIATGASVSETGDYKSLDALVYDLKTTILDKPFQNAEGLVVIMGSKLYSDCHFEKLNKVYDPMNENAVNIMLQKGIISGLPVVESPYMPDTTLVVTTLDNLSFYYQNGKLRRTIVDNAKRNRVESYNSSNDGYIVEEYGVIAIAEDIVIGEAGGGGE